jgi:class 3 adenylate cyclase
VLCTEEVRDAAPDEFDWSFARKHKLKGMSEAVPLYRARRHDSAGPEPAEESEKAKKKSTARRRRTRAAS